jgi:putative transposase
VKDLAELNRLFTAWCERVYHARAHSETGQPPAERWLAGAPFPVPDPAQLREAFLWSEHRIVRKDATLSLFGVLYQVSDLSLAGRKIECVFDPFDLSVLEVRWNGRPCGTAVPQKAGRHSHPKAKPEQPDVPPRPTGIDYLGLLRAEHEEATRRDRIRYDALAGGEDEDEAEDGR